MVGWGLVIFLEPFAQNGLQFSTNCNTYSYVCHCQVPKTEASLTLAYSYE